MPANFSHQTQNFGGPPPPPPLPPPASDPVASSGSVKNSPSVAAPAPERTNLLDDIRNFGNTSRLKVCHMFFFRLSFLF